MAVMLNKTGGIKNNWGNTSTTDTKITDEYLYDLKTKTTPPGNPGNGTNNTASINATLASGKRSAPSIKNQYTGAIADLLKDVEGANQLYGDNIDLAYDTYNKNMVEQGKLNDDAWLQWYQKIQNEEAVNNTQLGTGRYGSLNSTKSSLKNLTNDQFNQNNLANFRQGSMNYYQSLMENVNQNINAQRQNNLNAASQLEGYGRQYQAAVSDMLNNILTSLGSLNAKKYIDSNGNVTNAGWDYVNQLGLGATSDGHGGINVDTSGLAPEGTTIDELLANLRNQNNSPFLTADYGGFRRSLDETNKTIQDRYDTINRTKSQQTLYSPRVIGASLERRYG